MMVQHARSNGRGGKRLRFEELERRCLLSSTPWNLATQGEFFQNWSNTGLITANNNWNNVPSIVGYRGDGLTTTTGVDPQTVLAPSTVVNVTANVTTAPGSISPSGVAEFHSPNGSGDPTVAIAGSTTADAPHLVIYLNTSGRQDVSIRYELRDIDLSTRNSIQPIALQYRLGGTGNFINVPQAFVNDASHQSTNIEFVALSGPFSLPAWSNQSLLELRIITTDAAGTDEWIGIDNIRVTSNPLNTPPVAHPGAAYSISEGQSLQLNGSQSFDPDGDTIVSYVWQINGQNDAAAGVSPSLNWAALNALGINNDGVFPVRLTVTDSRGASTTSDPVNLTVANAPPAIVLSGNASVRAGADYLLSTSFFDPGNDAFESLHVDWGDGSGVQHYTGGNLPNPFPATHSYVTHGAYTIAAYAADADGADSPLQTIGLTVRPAGDYNDAGSVDAADYILWRKTLGTTDLEPFESADGNGDRTVDELDYGIWREDFGAAVALPSAAPHDGGEQLAALHPGNEAFANISLSPLDLPAANGTSLSMLAASARPRKASASVQLSHAHFALLDWLSSQSDSREDVAAADLHRPEAEDTGTAGLALDSVLVELPAKILKGW